MPAQTCLPHLALLHAPKEVPGAFSRSLWMSREEEHWLWAVWWCVQGQGSALHNYKLKNLRSKCPPLQIYPLFTGRWE